MQNRRAMIVRAQTFDWVCCVPNLSIVRYTIPDPWFPEKARKPAEAASNVVAWKKYESTVVDATSLD